MGPEPSCVALGEPSSGLANGLTRKPAAEEIHPGHVAAECPHVRIARDVGPVSGEDLARVRVRFALPADAEAGAFKAEINAADGMPEKRLPTVGALFSGMGSTSGLRAANVLDFVVESPMTRPTHARVVVHIIVAPREVGPVVGF